MRDYLYIWHSPATKRLILSGVQFSDLVPELGSVAGLILLRHEFGEPSIDQRNGFHFVPVERIDELAGDNVYGYGDFCWADFAERGVLLSDESVAELAFFGQVFRPLRSVEIPGLGNRLLCYSHDDGWYARLFYSDWASIERLLLRLLREKTNAADASRVLQSLAPDEAAFWIRRGIITHCERTEDIDGLMTKY